MLQDECIHGAMELSIYQKIQRQYPAPRCWETVGRENALTRTGAVLS